MVSIADCRREDGPALRIDEQRVEVVRIDDRESAAGEHRQGGKDVNAGARLGCQGAGMLAQRNPLADDFGQAFQRLADRAAGFALQRERGGEEAIFGQLVAIGQCDQRLFQRHAEGDLIGKLAKLLAGRIGGLSAATLRMPPVIGMPTRTARTSIDRASGNCSNRVRRRRFSHQR